MHISSNWQDCLKVRNPQLFPHTHVRQILTCTTTTSCTAEHQKRENFYAFYGRYLPQSLCPAVVVCLCGLLVSVLRTGCLGKPTSHQKKNNRNLPRDMKYSQHTILQDCPSCSQLQGVLQIQDHPPHHRPPTNCVEMITQYLITMNVPPIYPFALYIYKVLCLALSGLFPDNKYSLIQRFRGMYRNK